MEIKELHQKVALDRTLLAKALGSLKKKGCRIVMTNGCFDLLHYGHISYLRQAKFLGDTLLVALNSDASVRRLKGPTRPVTPEKERLEVLAALECVDFVTLFDEDTPLELIKQIVPNVLVKGGDWTIENIVGRSEVEKEGGQVISIPYLPGYSTTAILEKISKGGSLS